MSYRFLSIILTLTILFGCTPSYPKDYVEQSIKEICQKEYGITDVDVQIRGKTVGVYLPLKQLFSVDYERFLAGQISGEDLENLVQFHPEALDKVEDVLFSTSRVILSTDREIDFYMLSAVDTLVTGLQFSITGNILDMKRVRFWDIPRSEYRKRLIHDISINQSVAWKRNVRNFFRELPAYDLEELFEKYTLDPVVFPESSSYFYEQIEEAKQKPDLRYEIIDIRAKPLQGKEVLVYAKVKEIYDDTALVEQDFQFGNEFVGEYLFILSLLGMDFKIVQVIPFYYLNEAGAVTAIEFPENLKIYQNLDEWPEDFDFEEIAIEDFLAQQMTKRVQVVIAEDTEIQKEFLGWKRSGKLSFVFNQVREAHQEDRGLDGYFTLNFFLSLRTKLLISVQDVMENEHLLYLLEKVLREFTSVVNAYSFDDYTHLDIQLPVADSVLMISKKDLKRFHKKKLSIEELLQNAKQFG